MPAKHHRWQEARYHNSEATHRCAHSESHKPCALGSTTQLSPHREDSAMEHTLNRQTTTILTYINQGRRPVAFPVSLPVRPAVGPVWPRSPRPVRARRAVRRARPGPDGIRRLAPGPVRGHAGPAAQPSVSAGACAPPSPCARRGRPPQDGWTDREGMNEYE